MSGVGHCHKRQYHCHHILSSDKELSSSNKEIEYEATSSATTFTPHLMIPFGGRRTEPRPKWGRKMRNRIRQKNQRRYGQDSRLDCVPEGYVPLPIPVPTTKFLAWVNIVQASRLIYLPNSYFIFNKEKLINMVEFEISDSGAIVHLLLEGPPVVNMKAAIHTVAIKPLNGTIIYSTYTCNLNMPQLLDGMTEARIVPGLAHSSLISSRKSTGAGCKLVFDESECRVFYKGELVLSGGKDPRTNC